MRGESSVVVARHLEGSARRGDEQSIELLMRASTAAARTPVTAVRFIEAALSLLPADAGAERRADVLGSLAAALANAGRLEESHEVAGRPVAAAADATERRVRVQNLLAQAETLLGT